MTTSHSSSWGRTYVVCQKCSNWIWQDKLRPDTRCRKCGNWWPSTRAGIGKGKGQGRPSKPNDSWHRGGHELLDKPPGLQKLKPLKKSMPNQTANDLLTSSWDVIPPEVQTKLQHLGFGPPPPEEPGLEAILQTHLKELPQAVQDVVNKMQQPIPDTEKALAQKLKTQVTELKTISMKKAQLQTRLDQVKSQYANRRCKSTKASLLKDRPSSKPSQSSTCRRSTKTRHLLLNLRSVIPSCPFPWQWRPSSQAWASN